MCLAWYYPLYINRGQKTAVIFNRDDEIEYFCISLNASCSYQIKLIKFVIYCSTDDKIVQLVYYSLLK